MIKVKLIMSMVSLGIYGAYYLTKMVIPPIAKKVSENRARKAEKMERMNNEAIDVEWRFV